MAIYTLFTEDFLTKALWENLTVSLVDFISMPCTNVICSTSDDYFFSCITKTHLSVLITLVFMIYNVAINVKICVLMCAFSSASTCALMSFMDWDCDLSLRNVGLVHTERERQRRPIFFLLLWSNKSFLSSHTNGWVGRFDTQAAMRWTALSVLIYWNITLWLHLPGRGVNDVKFTTFY